MPSRYTVTLATTDQIPANFIQNQFCLSGPGGDADDVRDALDAFYSSLASSIFPTGIALGGHTVKGYDLPGTPPNYPVYESTFAFSVNPSTDPMPREVALCLSFQADRVPGQPQARKRGRIYLGFLRESLNDGTGRPTSAAITTILDAYEALYDAIDSITDAGTLAVWSGVDGAAWPVTTAWIDNAFDTQRSRGVVPTSKTIRDLL